MKKILLTIAVTLLFTAVWAQSQLTTVRGKTKDGKSIKVEYYQGTVEDYVESVKYQLVDELQARVSDLQGKLDAANKQLKSSQGSGSSGNNAEIKRLNNQINELNKTLDDLQGQLVTSELDKDSIALANANLLEQVDAFEKRVDDLEKELAKASSWPTGLANTKPIVGVAFGLGPAFLRDELAEGWSKDVHWAMKVEVYGGTPRLSKSFPISVEGGLGIRSYKLSASSTACVTEKDDVDADGDSYHAIYNFSNRTESLSLTYLDIPIRACFGQPAMGRMGVYAKVGVTPSVKLASSFKGTGTYSLKGYYPQWDVTLENIHELDFGNGFDCYDDDVKPELNGFVLWGNLLLGGYMPFGDSPLLLNAAVCLDIPFVGAGKITDEVHLIGNHGMVVIPSFEIGLVIAL